MRVESGAGGSVCKRERERERERERQRKRERGPARGKLV